MSSSASPTTRTSSLIHITRLARGGMGTVDLVMRRSGDFTRFYALKRPHPDLTDEPTLRAMFLEEARIAGLLRHPNVVPVLDVGEDEQGPFLLMDFVEGVALTEILRGHPGHLPVEIVVEILRQVALGLEAAHELHGVDGEPLALVHRDVSPQNVLVGFDGVVRLTDFGIAKAVGTQSPATGQVLKGKIGYMSPEQLRFEP
ncbi:MAG: serine/threonine protein kinase, partial [Myxococcales bacterium]|nr:serine/threonine protein kinase [Myxococcales bacterium]